MTPAIWTGMYCEQSLAEALRTLHDCGWRTFEVSSEHLVAIEQDANPDAPIEAARRVAAELGLSMLQVHTLLHADVAHADLQQRQHDISRVRRHLRIAQRLGAKWAVLHPGHGSSALRGDLKQVLPPNIENLKLLADAAGALGIKLCIENMMDGRHRPGLRMFGSATHELLDLLERIDHSALGIVLDTSHANAQQLDIPAAIREYGARLWATHISDNDGSGDQHRTPFNGKIDWLAVVQAFKEIGYDGLFNLEIPGERHALLPVRKLKTTWAREVAEWLLQR